MIFNTRPTSIKGWLLLIFWEEHIINICIFISKSLHVVLLHWLKINAISPTLCNGIANCMQLDWNGWRWHMFTKYLFAFCYYIFLNNIEHICARDKTCGITLHFNQYHHTQYLISMGIYWPVQTILNVTRYTDNTDMVLRGPQYLTWFMRE